MLLKNHAKNIIFIFIKSDELISVCGGAGEGSVGQGLGVRGQGSGSQTGNQ